MYKRQEAKEATKRHLEIFGEGNYFLELQDHGIPLQRQVNQGIMRLSKELNIPLVATNACHYINAEDWEAHDIMLCIQPGKKVSDENRMRYDCLLYTSGSMVVFEDGRPKRNDYRKFKIRTVQGPNDYASMEEVLTRRFTHGMEELEEERKNREDGEEALDGRFGSFTRFPDLILMADVYKRQLQDRIRLGTSTMMR